MEEKVNINRECNEILLQNAEESKQQSGSTSEFKEHYEELKDDIVKAFIRDYDLMDNPEISLIKFSENIICQVTENELKLVLRINRSGYHTMEELENELIWITEIKKQTDINTATIYKGINDKVIQQFKSKAGITYTYSVQSFVKGISIKELKNENLYSQLENVGKIAAKLHKMEENNPHNKETFKRFAWDIEDTLSENARWGCYLKFPDMTSDDRIIFKKAADKIEARLKKYGRGIDRYGLIHADLHSENLLADDDKISLIDFDDCGFSWYLYDLAGAISQQSKNLKEMTAAYLKGYETIRSLSPEDKAEIETFILLRRLVRLGWLTSHSDNGIIEREGREYYEVTKEMVIMYLENN